MVRAWLVLTVVVCCFSTLTGRSSRSGCRRGKILPRRRTTARAFQARDSRGNPLLARLNPEHGPALLALGCDLVWASSWMAEANEEIAPRIELPQLPVVDWPEDQLADRGVHWKTEGCTERPRLWSPGRRTTVYLGR